VRGVNNKSFIVDRDKTGPMNLNPIQNCAYGPIKFIVC